MPIVKRRINNAFDYSEKRLYMNSPGEVVLQNVNVARFLFFFLSFFGRLEEI